jgi:GDP-mannose transporter
VYEFHLSGFIAGIVYSYAKAYPSKKNENVITSASQSYSDAAQEEQKRPEKY